MTTLSDAEGKRLRDTIANYELTLSLMEVDLMEARNEIQRLLKQVSALSDIVAENIFDEESDEEEEDEEEEQEQEQEQPMEQ